MAREDCSESNIRRILALCQVGGTEDLPKVYKAWAGKKKNYQVHHPSGPTESVCGRSGLRSAICYHQRIKIVSKFEIQWDRHEQHFRQIIAICLHPTPQICNYGETAAEGVE